MPQFHCTVEYRDETGRILHHDTELEAATGDDAALMAEMDLMEKEKKITENPDVVVEEIVCRQVPGGIDEPPDAYSPH